MGADSLSCPDQKQGAQAVFLDRTTETARWGFRQNNIKDISLRDEKGHTDSTRGIFSQIPQISQMLRGGMAQEFSVVLACGSARRLAPTSKPRMRAIIAQHL